MKSGPIRVTLLGGFRLVAGAAGVAELPRGVQRLIAYLALSYHPPRAAIAGQLWPDVSEHQAQGSLRSALWRVQRVAPGLIQTSGGALALAGHVGVDVRETVDWANGVLNAHHEGVDAPPQGTLAEELLPGWYDDWVQVHRESFRQLRMYAMEAHADRLGRQGRHAEAVQALYAVIRTEPLRESAHRTLVRLHVADGNVVEAVRAYESFRRLLGEDMGIPPSARMQALVAGLGAGKLPRAVVAPRSARPAPTIAVSSR
jgi:DNA-binding SARP family transcriptional activator